MKRKKCPYCGRRISYVSAFASRRKGEYVCNRCSKEMKVVISKLVFLFFMLFVIIALAIIAFCFMTDDLHNPMYILFVAIPLIVFLFISPAFVRFEPLKKYKKSMEARKAGIEYYDNIAAAELESTESAPIGLSSADSTDSFKINSDVFNKIKAERTAARANLDGNNILSSSSDIEINTDKADEKTRLVPVIENIKEEHASASVPLRRIHSDNARSVSRSRHYIDEQDKTEQSVNEKKQNTGNRYSANRRF